MILGLITAVLMAQGTTPAPPQRARATQSAVTHEKPLADLPLVEVAAHGPPGDVMAVVISGDGGWAKIDKQLAKAVATSGIPVVGLKARQYFWHQRTPDGAAQDLDRIIRYYLTAWGKSRVIVVGYSRGAEVVPFMTTRLPSDLLSRVALIALVGVAKNANFKFHPIDLISNRSRTSDLDVLAEVEKLRGKRILCFYGLAEKDSACRGIDHTLATAFGLPGGHHFNGDFTAIGDEIADQTRFGAR